MNKCRLISSKIVARMPVYRGNDKSNILNFYFKPLHALRYVQSQDDDVIKMSPVSL